MAKEVISFHCSSCGSKYTKWVGRCFACNEWDTIVQDQQIHPGKSGSSKNIVKQDIEFFSLDGGDEIKTQRTLSGLSEFDRVLGGGVVLGSATLIGGEPGIGKSTILLQTAAKISEKNQVYYFSGEESINQIRLRAKRIGLEKAKVSLISTNDLSDIISVLNQLEAGSFAIIDSIQTIFSSDIQSALGSVSQIRLCSSEIISVAKRKGISVFIVGHITKDGDIAGPKVLEHMVDTVLYFEGEKNGFYRLLRCVKNRFGPSDEVGIFEMTSLGFIETKNPSKFFLLDGKTDLVGTVTFAGLQGTRAMLIDIEALVVKTFLPSPRRVSVGFDSGRLAMITAVLDKKLNLKLFDKDIYVNVSGGIKITETAADLAVAMAIISSVNQVAIPRDYVFFGEISLSGQIRNINLSDQRIKEASQLGYKIAVCSDGSDKTAPSSEKNNIEKITIKTIQNLLNIAK